LKLTRRIALTTDSGNRVAYEGPRSMLVILLSGWRRLPGAYEHRHHRVEDSIHRRTSASTSKKQDAGEHGTSRKRRSDPGWVDEGYEPRAPLGDLERTGRERTNAPTPAATFFRVLGVGAPLSARAATEAVSDFGDRHNRLPVEVNRLAEYGFH
jgi:hypothetical protein